MMTKKEIPSETSRSRIQIRRMGKSLVLGTAAGQDSSASSAGELGNAGSEAISSNLITPCGCGSCLPAEAAAHREAIRVRMSAKAGKNNCNEKIFYPDICGRSCHCHLGPVEGPSARNSRL